MKKMLLSVVSALLLQGTMQGMEQTNAAAQKEISVVYVGIQRGTHAAMKAFLEKMKTVEECPCNAFKQHAVVIECSVFEVVLKKPSPLIAIKALYEAKANEQMGEDVIGGLWFFEEPIESTPTPLEMLAGDCNHDPNECRIH